MPDISSGQGLGMELKVCKDLTMYMTSFGQGLDLKVCEDLTTYLTVHLGRDWEWI